MTASAGHPLRPTTLQIDLDAAAANVRVVRQLVGPARKIFAVVKADGYGHGAAELGAVFVAHGAVPWRWPIWARASGSASAGSPRPSSSIRTRCRRRAGGARPSPHADPGRSRRRGCVRAGRDGAVRHLRQDRRGARAPGCAGRAGGEDHHGHAGAAAPAARRAVRPSSRPRHRSGIYRMAARPLHRGRRRAADAGDRGTRPSLRGLALRAALPADVPQRRRPRPDALRHHVPRRDDADAAAAGFSDSSPASSRSRS